MVLADIQVVTTDFLSHQKQMAVFKQPKKALSIKTCILPLLRILQQLVLEDRYR